MKNILILIVIVVLAIGAMLIFNNNKDKTDQNLVFEQPTSTTATTSDKDSDMDADETLEITRGSMETIGQSVEGNAIEAHRFGDGDKSLVFIGAIHGGYEWNSALLAYELIDHLTNNPEAVPEDLEVIVIPVANPDGLKKAVASTGRFIADDAPQFEDASEITLADTIAYGRPNANNVDLNRNFDCKWQAEATWRDDTVSGGTEAFSEPESQALRDLLLAESPEAVVFYHSASNGVYTSFCEDDPLEGTVVLLDLYTESTGYQRFDDYTYYEVTGDAADWLATVGTPAITVELATHTAVEWDKNWKGIQAMLSHYSSK